MKKVVLLHTTVSWSNTLPCSCQDCYILDQCGMKIYVWKGRDSTREEKQQATSRALVSVGLQSLRYWKLFKGSPELSKFQTMTGTCVTNWHCCSFSAWVLDIDKLSWVVLTVVSYPSYPSGGGTSETNTYKIKKTLTGTKSNSKQPSKEGSVFK